MECDVISVYSKEQAIEDEVLSLVGEVEDADILFTTHLVAELSKEDLLRAVCVGLSEVHRFLEPDLAEFSIGGRRVWVDWNGRDITFMLPEDY